MAGCVMTLRPAQTAKLKKKGYSDTHGDSMKGAAGGVVAIVVVGCWG